MSRRKYKKQWKKFLAGRGPWVHGFTVVNPGSHGWLYWLVIPMVDKGEV